MPAPAPVITSFTITVDGAALSADELSRVESIEWRSKYNSIPSCEIVLTDNEKDPFDWHGKTIDVAINVEDDERAKFKGEVVRLRHVYRGQGDYRCIVEARPKPWRMAMGASYQSFLEKKTSDIVSKCVSDSGCTASAEATSVQHEFVLQCNESNLSFIARLLEDEGHCFWVDAEEKLNTAKAITFSGSATEVAIDQLKSAFMEHRQAAEKVDVKGWFSGAEPDMATGSAPNAESAVSVGTILERSPSVAPGMQDSWKTGAIARIEGDRTLVHAEIVEPPAIELGKKLDLKIMFGQSDLNVATVSAGIIEFTIRIDQENGFTASIVGVETSNSNATKHSTSTYLPPRSAPRPVLSGVFRAIVANVEDPDLLGRIKIKFPTWDDQVESFWAPYSQAMAGANRGVLFYPQVADEVLVVFENGDPRFPVVIGSVYNSKDKPVDAMQCGVYQDGGAPVGTGIWDGQNEIALASKDGERAIYVRDSGEQNSISMKADDKTVTLISPDSVITIETGDASIVLDGGSGDITIKCNNLNIEATSNIEAKATMDAKLEGANVKAKAQVGIALEGAASAELKASGQTTVKGAMVMIN